MKVKSFAEQFNKLTNNEYEFLRLKSVDILVRKKSIVVNFIYPEEFSAAMDGERERIETAAIKSLQSNVPISVNLTPSHFDKEHFIIDFREFLKEFPAIAPMISEDDILIDDSPDRHKIIFNFNKFVCSYCEDKNFLHKVKEFLVQNYCGNIDIAIEEKGGDIDLGDFEDSAGRLVLDEDTGRYIEPINIDALIGAPIYEKAGYIEDAVRPKDSAVLCGKIVQFNEITKKSGDGKFYKITIEDFTGRRECLFFPSKYNKDKITLLQNGKEVIMRGSLEVDKFNPDSLAYIVKSISYCSLPENFKINKLKRVVPEKYSHVFPKPYVMARQGTLFDAVSSVAPQNAFLNKQTFCVFDIETTGLNPRESKIIEIAGVKIVNGIFTEVFSTFVDPQMPIPERITELTGITDRDVQGAPLVDDVLIDFYKFSDGCALVGQNIQFDYSFISIYGRALNIYFENKQYDTVALSRKHFPGLKKYKLEYLTDFFGITLDGAHRAINDAIATAEVFLKISNKMSEND